MEKKDRARLVEQHYSMSLVCMDEARAVAGVGSGFANGIWRCSKCTWRGDHPATLNSEYRCPKCAAKAEAAIED